LKVIKIIIKRRVAGQGDFVTIPDTQNVSSVIVGQKIELKVEVKPDNTEFSNVWTITDGKPIKDYQPTKEKAEVKNLTNTDYAQKTITYYHTAGGNATVKSTVTINGKNKEKSVGFGVQRPSDIKEIGKWYPATNPINLVRTERGREMVCQIDIRLFP
jgi:VCBS repeat-containing protein